MKYNLDEIKKGMLSLCDELGRYPSMKEINECDMLPHRSAVLESFKRNGLNCKEFCEENGYFSARNTRKYTIEELEEIWDSFYQLHNRYPNSRDKAQPNFPSYYTMMRHLGNEKEAFLNVYKNKELENFRLYYNNICEKFKQKCIDLGRTLTSYEFNEYGFPNYRWFVDNSEKSFQTYVEFVVSLGLVPNSSIPKDIAIREILKKQKKVNRNLKMEDFYNVENNETIGIRVIKRHWGTFNNMLLDLNLPINQEDMTYKHKPIEELKLDVINVCQSIFEKEGRKNIAHSDIDDSELCLSSNTYNKWFKKELNMTLSEFIESIGFIPNESGMGMNHIFEDGEKTTSKFEFDVSKFLRQENISYQRNVPYSEFISSYEGNKDCDYVVQTSGNTYYIEIAGMLDYRKISTSYDDEIRKRYKANLQEKINMLEKENLTYKVIYPKDLIEPLDEVFSFVQ